MTKKERAAPVATQPPLDVKLLGRRELLIGLGQEDSCGADLVVCTTHTDASLQANVSQGEADQTGYATRNPIATGVELVMTAPKAPTVDRARLRR